MVRGYLFQIVNGIKEIKKSGAKYEDIQDHPMVKNYIDKLEKLQLEKEAVLNMTFTMKKEMDELKNQNLKQHSEIMNLKSQYDIIKVNFYKIKEEKKQLEEELNKNGSSVDKKLKKKKK